RPDDQEPPQGAETVLLVEDNVLVREVTSVTLRQRGYTVIEAENGIDALHLARQHGKETIDLVLTDIVMPEMGGRQLAEQIRQMWPTIKIIYISGYTNDEISESGITETGAGFMQKPFTPAALAQKVREVLDR
ncbi:MAG: response regulator, partial [Chloroflexi bacterium]|nr:response regulator [Chloroflexota bacterium]